MTLEELKELSKEYDIEVVEHGGETCGRLFSLYFRSDNHDVIWTTMSGVPYTFTDVIFDQYANKMSITTMAKIADVSAASVRVIWERVLAKVAHYEMQCATKSIKDSRLILQGLRS